MPPTTLGLLLLNDVLPAEYQIKGSISKKQLQGMMTELARTDPQQYVKTISTLKRVGDAVATDVGITVGLDDIEPDRKVRDAILEPALARIKKTTNVAERIKIVEATQKLLLESTKKHPGQMTPMALSGARGNIAALMRTVTSPAAAQDEAGRTIPWLISKSYAEGLKPADAWTALTESRRNAIASFTSVAAPGEINKIIVNNMSDQMITIPDCGTKNGIVVDAAHAIDHYTAETGQLVTPQDTQKKTQFKVRSPMTCEAPDGICQKCYGLNTKGNNPALGTNVGIIAAHAMGEPVTQMALSAKHGGSVAYGAKPTLSGLSGLKQITEIPQAFLNEATLSPARGTVSAIKKAPQGGYYVHVQDHQEYVPPNLRVTVHLGDKVQAGDVLSEGIPKPDKIIKYKGLGAGRKYLTEQLHGIYQREGVDLDRRHIELLAKTDLNYIRIMDRDSSALGVLRGDIVDYNQFRKHLASTAKTVPIAEARGKTLGNNVLHHVAGTRVTGDMLREFTRNNIQTVPIAARAILHEPVMKPISRTPLLHPDFLARLAHRNLKTTLLEGAAFGDQSNLHGTHPIPAFIFGEEFGEGPNNRY